MFVPEYWDELCVSYSDVDKQRKSVAGHSQCDEIPYPEEDILTDNASQRKKT